MSKVKLFLRNILKMMVQNWILPVAYRVAKWRYSGEKTLYVFADAHHTALPFSLAAMHGHVESLGIQPVCHFYDYTHEGAFKGLLHAISFMDLYVRAKYVFICDTFVPVSSCAKDRDTRVVYLCHFSGPFKKIGYATDDDVPAYYSGNVFANYDLVPVSSEAYVPLLTDAMRQEEGVVRALGVSRSDVFYDEAWVNTCREEFYARYPAYRGKKILLWAPTFRGDASAPATLSNEAFLALQDQLGGDWVVLIKHHPHDDAVATDPRHRSNCPIGTERLLPVTDLFITDYSTMVLDYLAFEKPFLLFAPDLEEYERTRGFFIDYRAITKNLVTDPARLEAAVKAVYGQWQAGDREEIRRCTEFFVGACDGKSTPRILEYLHKMDKAEKEAVLAN